MSVASTPTARVSATPAMFISSPSGLGRGGPITVTVTGLVIGERRELPEGPSGSLPAADRGCPGEPADGSYFAPLAKARYLLLTTFKQKGTPVSATVPGMVEGDRAYF